MTSGAAFAEVCEFSANVPEAAGMAQSMFFRYAIIDSVTVGVDDAFIDDGVGGLVIAEEV